MICNDEAISELDSELGRIYSALMKQYKDNSNYKDTHRKRQGAWLKKRNQCKSSYCLKVLYNQRNNELDNILYNEYKILSNVEREFDGPLSHMVLTDYKDENICKNIQASLSNDPACRLHNSHDGLELCGKKRGKQITINGKTEQAFEEIATNQYGYTEIFKAKIVAISDNSIIYVQKFLGDKHPRLTETWKVNNQELESVLKLHPGALTQYEKESTKTYFPQSTNSEAFSELLKSSEKISNEWSPAIHIDGETFIIDRNCNGEWVYGSYYACKKTLSFSVKIINKNDLAEPFCHFEPPKE